MLGQVVICDRASKRLPEAEGRMDKFMADCKSYAEEPARDHICLGLALGLELEQDRSLGCQHVGAVAKEVTSWAREQLYYLYRVSSVADLTVAIAIWEECPRHMQASGN
jgi:hypothetical protein